MLTNKILLIVYYIIFQFKLIFPYWISGILVGSIFSVFVASKISSLSSKLNGSRYGLLAVLPAAILGAASPVCMYGTIPFIASLGRKGVPQYLLAAFMVSSILINPNLFIFSFTLGLPIALIRLFTCILAGIMAGLFVKAFYRKKTLFSLDSFEERKKCHTGSSAAVKYFSDVHRAIMKTAPYFLIGILLAALVDQYFPRNLITDMFGQNNGFGVLVAASLGVPIYVCGGGTIPLLKTWMDMGMSPGSAMAFMLSGPATKITNLTAVKIILGIRNFMLYIAFSITFSILAGLLTDFVWRFL